MCSIRPLRLFVGLAAFVVTAAAGSSVAADQWQDVPEFEDHDHLAMQRGLDGPRYDSVRECLEDFDSRVNARYFATLVTITDPEGTRSSDHDDASRYAAHAAEQWAENEDIDPESDVVVAVGSANRSIGIEVPDQFRQMGFDDQAFDDLLEASRVPSLVDRHAFDDAICSMARAVDHRLAHLEIEHSDRVQKARDRVPPAREKLAEVQDRVAQSLGDDHELKSELLDRLTEAGDTLQHHDPDDSPRAALEAVDEATEVTERVEGRLERYKRRAEPLDDLEQRIDALSASIADRDDADWSGPEAATTRLDECRRDLQQARRVEHPESGAIHDCIADAEHKLARSDVRHFFLARALPGGGLALFALVTITWGVARLRRRRRALGLLEPDLETWETGLDRAADKLEELKTNFDWYFDDRDQFWEGDHAETDRRIADGINRADLLRDRGRDLLNEAKLLREDSGLLGVGNLEEALEILRDTTVSLEPGDVETDRPLQLPLSDRFELRAAALIGEIDGACHAALRGLQQVAPFRERIAELTGRAQQTLEAAEQQLRDRQGRDLPVERLREQLDEARDRWSRATDRADRRPERAVQDLEKTLEVLNDIHSRAAEGNRIVDTVIDDVQPLRSTLDQRLERASGDDLEFGDRDFDPGEVLETTDERIDRILEFVSTGRESDARDLLEVLREDLERTIRQLDVCLAVDHLVPETAEELDELADRLEDSLFQARMKLKRVADDPDRAELTEHVDEIDRLQKIVTRHQRLISRIERALSDDKRLAAAADMTALVDAVCSGVDSIATVKQHVDETDDPFPDLPPEPIWKPAEAWRESAIPAWGRSEAAQEFRSISLP